jgi:hypothetical protein
MFSGRSPDSCPGSCANLSVSPTGAVAEYFIISPYLGDAVNVGSGLEIATSKVITDGRTREPATGLGVWAVVVILVSFLLVAPVIESGTSESSMIFQAIGTAEGGAGGG